LFLLLLGFSVDFTFIFIQQQGYWAVVISSLFDVFYFFLRINFIAVILKLSFGTLLSFEKPLRDHHNHPYFTCFIAFSSSHIRER